ncbi:hypothetical protein WT83_29065 [Burkholderia territorii]|uniref:Resolvase/invertase-type recombinase catalytic domain-containing protein n=1 Tax=Burkholderia territorii TaxID=1503055 RepID=A0A119VDN5_9BURK|nr:hypothetical protein WT83_29065 [Burkholderia territorii]
MIDRGCSLGRRAALIDDPRARDMHFTSLNEFLDISTDMFMFPMIAVFAAFECVLISERTQVGLAAARTRSSQLGRPKALTLVQSRRAQELIKSRPARDIAVQVGVHPKTLRMAL